MRREMGAAPQKHWEEWKEESHPRPTAGWKLLAPRQSRLQAPFLLTVAISTRALTSTAYRVAFPSRIS